MKIKRRTLALIIRWAIKITILTVVTALFYIYFFTQLFTITTYWIVGVDEANRKIIEEQLHNSDDELLFGMLPKDKIFTYGSNIVREHIIKAVPEVASIDMRPVGFNTVKIEIKRLIPIFRMSGTQGLTEDGFVFTTKEDLQSYPQIAIASSTTKTINNSGLFFTQLVIDDKTDNTIFLRSLHALTDKIGSLIFPVNSIVIETTGDVSCHNERGTSKILFLKDSDYKKVWSTLVSAIDTDPLKSKLKNDKDNLEYLDARYGNKVFYRFSDMTFQKGSVTGILGSHATTTQGTSTIPQ